MSSAYCARVVAVAAGIALAGCASLGSPPPGRVDGRLAECSPVPHCVSSLATDERHAIEPLQLHDPENGWPAVVEAVRNSARTTVVASDDGYVRAEVASPWHLYTDDLELVRGRDGRIDVRSSSRIGYYDFQVNRKRVEALRDRLRRAGVIR